ncbi:lanC-like protein GCL2 isoform X2 [Panicum virgatum]|uniref:LanC-like protein GCL2 n=1 Tax=Panicum virgatum TaxID=38727 RepID=A0A8T0Q3C1_PANVG|nr:lanC-like protein GCL2 isoform X2 [Panicum virgatum]KAG2567618.1 hypothetical protein PVAP13_7NG337000 [Panicum virgatum]
MADRFFPNDMPGYVEEEAAPAPAAELSSSSSLHTLLSLPYPVLAARFLHAALQLKQKVVHESWEMRQRAAGDFTLYTGALGTALLLFRAYSVTGDRADLATCAEIVAACDAASAPAGEEFVTFICGRAGICALGAVVAKHAGDVATVARYLNSFKQIKISSKFPDELLYGKTGYLWACSFLNKHLGENTIQPTTTDMVVREIIKDGRRLSTKSCPLMYEWYGEKYWGAAHGLAGIMHVLLDMDLTENDKEYVKGTLRYMIQNRLPSGNYPCTEGDNYDCLVHWCHGAPGVSLTLAKASQVFPEERFLEAAADAAEVVWNRGLLKRVGICHGISGNAYTFLSLYRLTKKKEYLYRAKAFACFLLDRAIKLIAEGIMHGGDEPYSLFEGQAGMAYLFLDMINPLESGFPAYEL